MRIGFLSNGFIFGVLAVVVLLIAAPFALYRPVAIACERGDDFGSWTCTTSRNAHVEVTGIVKVVPLDDAGSSLVANDRELARFHRRDGAPAMQAARDLSAMLAEPGARTAKVTIARSAAPEWFVAAASLLVALLIGCAYFRPLSFMIDSTRRTLFVKQDLGLSAIALDRVQAIRARGREIEIALGDGIQRTFAPAGWTEDDAVRNAHRLRDAVTRDAE